eukprot:3317328-Amphidinium_carterae.1
MDSSCSWDWLHDLHAVSLVRVAHQEHSLPSSLHSRSIDGRKRIAGSCDVLGRLGKDPVVGLLCHEYIAVVACCT